jgi:hypothetical protein
MDTFENYSESFEIACNPGFLDFSFNEGEFQIFEGSQPLLTPGGNYFSHSSEAMIRLLITDFQLYDGTTRFDFQSPLLYSFWKDRQEQQEEPFLRQWEKQFDSDPFVQIKTTGKSSVQPFGPEDSLFSFAYLSLASLIGTVNSYAAKIMGEVSMEESEIHPFREILQISYQRLTTFQKVAVQALSGVHQSGIVLPILFVSGVLSMDEYAKGLISLKIKSREEIAVILSDLAKIQLFLDSLKPKHSTERETLELIREGEGDLIEYKSTLRWDIRAGKTNPAIERSCLKTISAFLNSSGGHLLIGIRDDGSVEGIETDKFANEDKFLLHLWTLIRICLGRDFSPFIKTKLERMEEKTVCVVSCHPSDQPVFLRQPGFDEEMYIRLGPSSNSLNISEALKYIEKRF